MKNLSHVTTLKVLPNVDAGSNSITTVIIAGSFVTREPQQPDLSGPHGEEAAEGAVVPRGRPRLGRGGGGGAGGWRSRGRHTAARARSHVHCMQYLIYCMHRAAATTEILQVIPQITLCYSAASALIVPLCSAAVVR